MKTTLSHIAQLSSGIYTKPDFEGEVYYVQARHFNNDGEFDFSVKPDLRLEGKIEKHLLKAGDILLAVKGSNNFAVHYKGIIEKAVASSTFMVIRLRDQSKVLPDFLNWYLNHPQTQLFFKDKSKGSGIPSISIGSIENLEVYVPTIEKQQTVLKLYDLRKREKELKLQIEKVRENQIQQQLLDSIKN